MTKQGVWGLTVLLEIVGERTNDNVSQSALSYEATRARENNPGALKPKEFYWKASLQG